MQFSLQASRRRTERHNQNIKMCLPALLPLCFLQVVTLPWLLLVPEPILPLTFAPCCSRRAAACLPCLPPSAAAVTAFCSWEGVNVWAMSREPTADCRLCDS